MSERSTAARTEPAAAEVVGAYLLLVLAMLAWSGNIIVGRAFAHMMMPLDLSFMRWLIAFLVVLPFTLRELVAKRRVILQRWRILLVLGLLGLTISNSCTYLGLQWTTALNGALVNSAGPMLTLAASFAFFRERASRWQAAGILVSLFGVLVIVLHGDPAALLSLRINPGDALILASVTSWAVYSVLLRRRPPELSPLALLAVLFAIGALTLLPVRLGTALMGHPLLLSATAVAGYLYVGVFPAVVAFFGWNRAIAVIGANRASLFNHLMPVFVAALAYFLLGESITAPHLVGGALIFAGIFLANRRPTV